MTSAKGKKMDRMLTDPTVPMRLRRQLLEHLCSGEMEDPKDRDRMLNAVLEAAALASAGEQYVEKTRELAETLQQLAAGPLRCAIFERLMESERLGRRAEVTLPDGTSASCVVPEEKLASALRAGDTVWMDAQARTLLFHQPEPTRRGEQARFERRLAQGDVEVSVGNDQQRLVCRPSAQLLAQIDRGDAQPGCAVVVCPRRMMAFYALPSEDAFSHLRFLAREPVPDVVVERDVGAPPAFLGELEAHVRRELSDPGLSRRYRLRRSRLLLVTGVPGSGKTYSIDALWRRLYEVASEATGVPLESLPPRVFRLCASDVLSKWLGDSDRNLARFFDEVEQVAQEPFAAPDGRCFELPVLVILEEIDALARQRGDDAIHDRIQTTLLTRLDPGRWVFRDRPVIVVCTSNVPGLLDAAFVRRAGGRVATFGHLDRRGFRAVLEKQLRGRPFSSETDEEGGHVRRRAIGDLTAWLFAANASDGGVVELDYMGRPGADVRHRRDFLTAGLVDRAVDQAASEACDEEWHGGTPPGITTEALARALDAQVRHVADQLTAENCGQYLALPDAVRVGSVRRLPRPACLSFELESGP